MKVILTLTTLAIMLSLSFFNCQKTSDRGFKESASNQDPDDQLPLAKRSPFADQKVVVDYGALLATDPNFQIKNPFLNQNSSQETTFSSEQIKLASETQLVALMNNECAALLPASSGPQGNSAYLSQQILAQNNFNSIEELSVQAYRFALDSEKTVADLELLAEADDCIIGISQNTIFRANVTSPNDPYLNKQGFHQSIHTLDGWETFFSPDLGIKSDVIVADIDTGVDYLHPDLTKSMWKDSNGKFGTDFINNDNDPMDDHYHGTHVAGLIGAQANNGIGVMGTMGYHAKIMAVKVLSKDGEGSTESIVNGIRWAADNGVDIINMSLGGGGRQPTVEDALNYATEKGVVILVAAANDGQKLTSTNFISPASYAIEIPGMIAVGSFDAGSFLKSSFSNYSPTYVDIASPGSDENNGQIVSTIPDSKYGGLAGTSMATPVATGAVALVIGLLKSHNISYSPALIEEIFLNGAKKNPNFVSQFKDGNQLDISTLANYVMSRMIIDDSGGLEEP